MIVIIEGIYSMEGEMARLAEIVAIKKKYKVGSTGQYRAWCRAQWVPSGWLLMFASAACLPA